MNIVTSFRNCPKGRYHSFKVISSPYTSPADVQTERCRFCGVIERYNFNADGTMTNEEKYWRDHIRAFAQPGMAVYFDINRDAEEKFKREEAEQAASQARQDELSARFKHAVKDALK